MAVTSRPFHSRPIPRSASATAASSSNRRLHDLLAEQLPGLGERAAGRDLRARPQPQAGQPERRRQHRVIPGAGEQAGDQHADHGHLRGQHPVVLMARGRFPQRAGDHVLGEQLLQQALPVQFRQPVRPEPRPGRDPGGHLRSPGFIFSPRRGRSGRRRDDHGKLGIPAPPRATTGPARTSTGTPTTSSPPTWPPAPDAAASPVACATGDVLHCR